MNKRQLLSLIIWYAALTCLIPQLLFNQLPGPNNYIRTIGLGTLAWVAMAVFSQRVTIRLLLKPTLPTWRIALDYLAVVATFLMVMLPVFVLRASPDDTILAALKVKAWPVIAPLAAFAYVCFWLFTSASRFKPEAGQAFVINGRIYYAEDKTTVRLGPFIYPKHFKVICQRMATDTLDIKIFTREGSYLTKIEALILIDFEKSKAAGTTQLNLELFSQGISTWIGSWLMYQPAGCSLAQALKNLSKLGSTWIEGMHVTLEQIATTIVLPEPLPTETAD